MPTRDVSYLWNPRRLRRWYTSNNENYFNGKLPQDAVLRWELVVGICANVTIETDKPCIIRVNPTYAINKAMAKWCLLHEMSHMHLWPYIAHGPKFQAEMLRLAKAGAFRGIW